MMTGRFQLQHITHDCLFHANSDIFVLTLTSNYIGTNPIKNHYDGNKLKVSFFVT